MSENWRTLSKFPPGRLKDLATCLILFCALLAPCNPAFSQEKEPEIESRQDYHVGTTHEGIVMEQDPVTGDRVIQVTPPPREEEQQEPPVLLIQPEIHVPVR